MSDAATVVEATAETPADAATTATAQPETTGANATTTTGTEPQDAGAKPDGDKGEHGKEGEKADETYEYQMPEGLVLDKSAADALTAFAKEHGLKPDVAQKVADIGVQMMQRQVDAHAQTVTKWIEEVRSDKEIGGEKLDESLATAKRAIDFIGDPALKELLNTTGYGNNPVLVRAFIKIGKTLAPDTVENGQKPAHEEASAARMYSASNMNP